MGLINKDLLEALSIVKPAVSTKDFQLILKCFIFKDNKILGYNGEVYVETQFESEWNCAIPADLLYKLLITLPPTQEINITVDDTIKIKAGKVKAEIPMLSIDDFPIIETSEEGTKFELSGNTIDAIDKCMTFMSKDETQPAYGGVYVDNQYVYATDGFRLARCKTESEFSLFIPRTFCALLVNMKPPHIYLHENHLKCSTRRVKAYSTVLSPEHKPPDYASVFDSTTLSKERLIEIPPEVSDALTRGIIFTEGMIDKCCKLTFNKDELSIEVLNSKIGKITENISTIINYNNETAIVDLLLLQSILANAKYIELINKDNPLLRGVKDDFEVLLTTLSE